MTFFARLLTLVLAAMALLVAAPPRADAAVTVGMGDQKLDMWHDLRFDALGLKHVRLIVSYDRVLNGDFVPYDTWMAAAKARDRGRRA